MPIQFVHSYASSQGVHKTLAEAKEVEINIFLGAGLSTMGPTEEKIVETLSQHIVNGASKVIEILSVKERERVRAPKKATTRKPKVQPEQVAA